MRSTSLFLLSALLTFFLLAEAGKKARCGVEYYCEKMGPPCCGNGICQPDEGESCENCPEDCGKCASCEYCGNNLCEVGESPCSCPQDCGPCCCDGKCSFPETFQNCPQECSGTAYVQAIDWESGNPLTGVNVTCVSGVTGALPELLTDTDGSAVFGELEPTSYACHGSLDGYYSNSAAVQVIPGERVSAPSILSLKKMQHGTITGYARYNFPPYPSGVLRGVNVTCADQDTVTDRAGRFYFLKARLGSLRCDAVAPGYARTYFSVNVTAGQNTDVDISLAPLPGTLLFSVLDIQNETAIVDASVSCTDVEKKVWNITATTSSSGMASLNNVYLEQGCTVSCTFSARNYLTWSHFFTAKRGKISSFEVTLSRAI